MRRRIAASVGLLGLIGAVWCGVDDHVVGTEPPAVPTAAPTIVKTAVGTNAATVVNNEEPEGLLLVPTAVPAKVPAAESTFEPLIQRLQPLLKKRFPKCAIEIVGLHDRLIIKGSATTSQAAAIVVAVQTAVDLHSPMEHPQSGQVINLLAIPGEAQVLLHVKIIEADRKDVTETFQRLWKSEQPASKSEPQKPATTAADPNSPSGIYSKAIVEKAVAKLLKDPSSKSVCEPSMTVLSGMAASFINGGEFGVPTIVGVGGAQKTTTSFRRFGTSLQVTPTVIDSEQLRLELICESNQLDESNKVAGIPGINSRRINTLVLLRPDQALVMKLPMRPAYESAVLPDVKQARDAAPKADQPANSERCLFITVTPEVLKQMTSDQVPQTLTGVLSRPDVYTELPPSFGPGSAPLPQLFPTVLPPLVHDLVYRTPLPAAEFPQSPPPAFGPFGPIQQLGGWQPMPSAMPAWPTTSVSRLQHLKSALKHLESAGMTDQVAAIKKEIELEQQAETRRELTQRKRELETLQRQIESLRRSLSPQDEPSPQ